MLIHHVTPVLMVTGEVDLRYAESLKMVGTGILARRLNASHMRGWKMTAKERKSGRMIAYFGSGEGTCADCENLAEHRYSKRYYKCAVYGETSSEASDWRKSYPACAMKNKEWNGNNMMTVFNRKRETAKEDIQIEGQVSIFDEGM